MSPPRRRSDHLAPVAPLHPRERWLTFKEAAEALERDYGVRTTARTLEKLAAGGKPGAMPSSLNFGRRQVQLSRILPWLHERGYIAEAA